MTYPQDPQSGQPTPGPSHPEQPDYIQPDYSAGAQSNWSGQSSYDQFTQPAPGQYQPVQKPEPYLVWTILATVLCCLPLGAVGIYFSTRVDKYWVEGRFAEAEDASKKAKQFAIISAVAGVVVAVLYFALVIGLGVWGYSESGQTGTGTAY